MTANITTAIRADAATSDAEGRRDLAGHLADFRAALLDEAALIAAADRSRFDSEVATLTATRDIVIGQRETAQRERDEARGLLGALTADLNATREKLTTAEAFRDSLQAEVDGLRVERDAQQADLVGLHCAAAERDTVRELHKSACAERDALRAEVDKLRARPVLTEEAAIAAAREAGWSSSAGRDAETVISCILAHLGAVTLPAQDRAEELAREVYCEAGRRNSSLIDAITGDADRPPTKLGGILGVALSRIAERAPATTPSKPAEDDSLPWGVVCARDVPTEVRERGWQWHPIDSDTAFAPPFATIRVCRHCGCLVAGGPTACVRCANDSAPTPSKPADVFAGVSIGKLCDAYDCAGACGSADVAPRRYAGVMAVLDALRVKLVAPVDPEEVARDYMERVVPGLYDACKSPSLHFSSMRLALEAKGIPVTPEAGK